MNKEELYKFAIERYGDEAQFGATLPVNRIKSNKLQRLAERLGVKDYD